ncbi:hypothetical protein FISHEDRAFT_36404 [Fistulina hepatica ATCC 64428]|uniref:CWH43-like N-terminal domain-containing protein n=1 Tax=Fistulina hepatica ATCC 64428 TaxID=1128425 RepID=A0A0D7AM16_9AGAR|nr:hypothetical protein FISHEDRAFT_36404 [Fistulina hepatica ATCC 64428]
MPFEKHRHHWLYIWIPIFGDFIWFGTLLSMLITWVAEGCQRYSTMEQSIAYISDIGAEMLKPLFVTGCSITAVSFFLCLFIDRWLRHEGRLVPDMRRREKVLSMLAVCGAFIGGCGLILLSVFDTKRYPSLHRAFLLVFMIGVVLSAIFTIVEYRWLSKDLPDIRQLRIAYIVKAVIASTLIIWSIVFAATLYTAYNVGAVFEWMIAFGFTAYILTFWYDFRQSRNFSKGALIPLRARHQAQMADGHTSGHVTAQ